MSKELSTEISPEIINSLILTGDMSQLKPAQQTAYYNAVCESLDINPLTQPFAIITLQGKKILYATKGCTQQLSSSRKINTEIKERKTVDTIYIASCRATMPDGRFTDDDGIVSIVGLKGNELANAMMKAITKAKRRAVLALCGLGMPDETEIEDMPNNAAQYNAASDKSRVEQIIETTASEVTENVDQDKIKEESKKEAIKKTTKASKEVHQVEHTEGDGSKTNSVSEPVQSTLPEGHKLITGVIEGIPKSATFPNPLNDNKPGTKYNFMINGIKYGTFDQPLVDKIMAMLDIQSKSGPIMVNIEYKERKSGDKILNDIVKFSQVTTRQIPI